MPLPDHLILATTPTAPEASVITGATWRITVLTERLLRLEHSAGGEFEDRATQTVVNRDFPTPQFQVERSGDAIGVSTPFLRLNYDGGEFSSHGLRVDLIGGHDHGRTWRYGVPDRWWEAPSANLGGTARTLDEVDGATPLEDGVLSRSGYAVLDDSGTITLTDDGWIAPREPGAIDLYLFAHGDDYAAALADFMALTGRPPLLPRWAFGNWWSRYHPYTDAEYLALFDRFEAERLPFSVAVIDMDWHLVDIPPEFGTGWTGYTWNRELFPDPAAFLADLHRRGLKVSLNTHPADGIRPHEEVYPAMATAMGIDPDSQRPVAFDIADQTFLRNYLEVVHHPLEEQGVDFWWLDWQQGTHTAIPGLDPLWMLNHYHFLDSARRGGRPMTFSRYAGPGSHRYPVGFSGDTINTWESLEFQPFFTATAANIAYGWWSHDIGGHMFGYRSDELVTRWFQFGTFSPINRLHSTLNPFMGKEPWKYNAISAGIMGDFLRLRHRLLPYLFTMNERSHRLGEALCTPLYHRQPWGFRGRPAGPEAAEPDGLGPDPDEVAEKPISHGWKDPRYHSPNTYFFGTELLVAALTAPVDPGLQLAATSTWLPRGDWIDWFTGQRYAGGRRLTFHRPLDQLPVLARAGAIVPLTGPDEFGVANPSSLELRVFAGADGAFELYEDDDAADPRSARTVIEWSQESGVLRVHPAQGDLAVVPSVRSYRVVLVGVARPSELTTPFSYDEGLGAVTVDLAEVATDTGFILQFGANPRPAAPSTMRRIFELLERAQIEYQVKDALWAALLATESPVDRVIAVDGLNLDEKLRAAVMELLLAER